MRINKFIELSRKLILGLLEKKILAKEQIKLIKFIGAGKDGRVYLGIIGKENKKYIIKILSNYGKKYLFMVKYFIKNRIISRYLYNPQIISNRFLVYPYEKLQTIKTDPNHFLRYLKQICDLEIDLLKHNLCYWDLGFYNHSNYMVNSRGVIKIIDYGGNSFLFVDRKKKILNTNIEGRKNLIFASNLFLQTQLLFHIYYCGLGRKTKENFPSMAQADDKETLNEYVYFCVDQMKNTIYEKIANTILSCNLLLDEGWLKLRRTIENVINSKDNLPQESADINNIKFLKNKVIVNGYQKYVITPNNIFPSNTSNSPIWNTAVKYNIVKKALGDICKIDKITDLLDIGSNLGLYVFLGKLQFKIKQCTGIDYNKDYVNLCRKIQTHLQIRNCTFHTKTFSDIKNRYDCVIAMAVIHHLFHRTEEFGSLKKIMKKFSQITRKYLIIEFPTEKDPKAMKWTNMFGREKEENYSLALFIKYARLYFSEIKKIGKVSPNRPVFLLKK